jgi:hypothetical protein
MRGLRNLWFWLRGGRRSKEHVYRIKGASRIYSCCWIVKLRTCTWVLIIILKHYLVLVQDCKVLLANTRLEDFKWVKFFNDLSSMRCGLVGLRRLLTLLWSVEAGVYLLGQFLLEDGGCLHIVEGLLLLHLKLKCFLYYRVRHNRSSQGMLFLGAADWWKRFWSVY